MSIKDQLQADLKTAMLNKQELRRDVIRFTQAALKNAELAKQQKLVKERSHLWQTGKVDEDGNPIVDEAERDKQVLKNLYENQPRFGEAPETQTQNRSVRHGNGRRAH